MFHTAAIGGKFYFAYEQLRNAAEYREHHLLLRTAIRRYLYRYVRLDRHQSMGADLVTELTEAGYLKNDTIPMARVRQIDDIIVRYGNIFELMHRRNKVDRAVASRWLFQISSVEIEDLLAPNRSLPVFMAFAYNHYLESIDQSQAEGPEPGETDESYQVALYCAVQRALFKSDLASVRYYCLAGSLPGLNEKTVPDFIRVNRLIDQLYQSPRTSQLFRLINRYAAPMRILRELFTENITKPETLADRGAILAKIKRICAQQYALTHKHLNSRIAKTILFILITKVLIGVAIEVPYDLIVERMVAWMPLILNITFPVVYMVLLSTRISEPDRHNTDLIAAFVDRILYKNDEPPIQYRIKKRVTSSSLSGAFNVVYIVGFTISFGLLIWGLNQLNFNLVNGFIFFIFLSAVSFLGFRLRQSARELAMLDEHQSLLHTLADFLSTPFVRVGYWLSDRYAKLNVVTLLLDVAVELPLKTSLRLVQQWAGFLRDKQEEL